MKLHRIAMATTFAAGLLALPTVASADHSEKTQLTFFMWAGANQGVVPTEVIEAYTKKHPKVKIDIIESNNTITYPKMVAARRVTPDRPLVHCGFFNVDSMTKGDIDEMWETLNPQNIPNMANVFERFLRPDNRGVGYQMVAIGLIYNKDKVKTPPTSWSALWDPAYRGRVVMFDYDTRALTIAALLNGGDEHNIDPGFEVWAENAKNFRALVDSNIGVKNLLVSGDAWISPWFSAIATNWIKEGAPLGFAVPKEGAIAFPIFLTIGQGVDDAQRVVCESLINSLLSAENAGRYGKLTHAIPAVRNASMSPEQLADPALNLDVADNAIMLDYAHIAKMSAEWRERWDREVKTKMR